MTNEDYQKIFHEIKNNITFINSSLQLIEKAHPQIQSLSYWNDTMQEIRSLTKMLTELSSARLTDNLNLRKIPLEHFLLELANSCTALFNSEDFYCDLSIESTLPEIFIDCDRFKRALFNLIKNSYEAMNASGILRLVASKEENFIRLDVIDCGGGISPEYLPKIFTAFETTKSNGTGLGLLITKQIIEAHGGYLSVDSRLGDGCTFSIYLPYV